MKKGEINLLPVALQTKRLHKSYGASLRHLLRRLIILLLLLVLAEIAVWGVFLAINRSVNKTKDLAVESGLDVLGQVDRTNSFVGQFERRLADFKMWSDTLDSVFGVTPELVTITQITVDEGTESIELNGQSPSQADLIDFQARLEQLSWVIDVEAPLSNFEIGLKSDYTLTVITKEEEPMESGSGKSAL